jgi:hypothetical protein
MVISLPYHYRKQSLLLRELGMSCSSRLPAIVRLRQTQASRAGSNVKALVATSQEPEWENTLYVFASWILNSDS